MVKSERFIKGFCLKFEMEDRIRELLKHPELKVVKEKNIDYSDSPLVAGRFSSDLTLCLYNTGVAVLNRNGFGGLSNRSRIDWYDEFKTMKGIFQERGDNPEDLSVIAVGGFLGIFAYSRHSRLWEKYGRFQQHDVESNMEGSFSLALDPKEQALYVFEKPSKKLTKLEFWK